MTAVFEFLDSLHVSSLKTFLTFFNFKFYSLTFWKRFVTVRDDRTEMNEYVLAAIILC